MKEDDIAVSGEHSPGQAVTGCASRLTTQLLIRWTLFRFCPAGSM